MQDSENRLASLYRRFDNVAAALDAYSNISESMTEGGRVLKEQASLLLREARQALRYRWQRLDPLDLPEREELRRAICNDFAAVLHELSTALLPALDGTRSNGVPIELEPVLTRLANRASAGTGGRVVLYASADLNYSIECHQDPRAALSAYGSAQSSTETPPSGDRFLFLRIPRIERDSGTLHTVIAGHELGHLRDWTYQLSDLPPTGIPSHWLDALGDIRIEFLDHLRRFVNVGRSWACEIVADLVAAAVMGPASLQALSELVGTLGLWTVDSASHPGADRRAAIILDSLDGAGFSTVPDLATLHAHFRSETNGALARAVQIEGSPFPEADSAAWAWVVDGLPTLRAACDAAVQPDERFDARDWTRVSEARDCLAAGKPCGEYLDNNGIPAAQSDAVIFNAAYLLRSASLDDLGSVLGLDSGEPAEASLVSAVLDGLVLKSFEVAEHRRKAPWQ